MTGLFWTKHSALAFLGVHGFSTAHLIDKQEYVDPKLIASSLLMWNEPISFTFFPPLSKEERMEFIGIIPSNLKRSTVTPEVAMGTYKLALILSL